MIYRFQVYGAAKFFLAVILFVFEIAYLMVGILDFLNKFLRRL